MKSTHNLTCIFREMVDMVSLKNTEIHPVQVPWPGKKELPCSQSCSYKFCQGDFLFLGGVTHGIPKDHGPEMVYISLKP